MRAEKTKTHLDRPRPRDRDDVLALREEPREGHLPSRRTVLLPDRLQPVREPEDVGKVLLRVPRDHQPKVARLEVLRAFVLPREQPAAERGVRDDRDAQLPRRPQYVDLGVLDVEREWRVLDLEGGDGVHGVRAAQGVGRALGEAEVLDLALFHELGHGADGVLDRHR